jgi:hypothetical protein
LPAVVAQELESIGHVYGEKLPQNPTSGKNYFESFTLASVNVTATFPTATSATRNASPSIVQRFWSI